jgi:hypothetical protein
MLMNYFGYRDEHGWELMIRRSLDSDPNLSRACEMAVFK